MWDHRTQVLYWVDIEGERDPRLRSRDVVRSRPWTWGRWSGASRLRRSGGIVAAVKRGFVRRGPGAGAVTLVAAPEGHAAGHRFNDGRCDPRGRFWAGTMAIDAAPGAGSLYRLDPDGTVHRILQGRHDLQRPGVERRRRDALLHRHRWAGDPGLRLRPRDGRRERTAGHRRRPSGARPSRRHGHRHRRDAVGGSLGRRARHAMGPEERRAPRSRDRFR